MRDAGATHRSRRGRLAALAALFFAGCQPAPERAAAPSNAHLAAETPVEAPVTVTSNDSLRLHLDVPGEVTRGDAVPITVRAENITDRTIDLYLAGRPIAWDVIVTDAAGAVVWRRLEGEIIAAALRIETLAPGEALELSGEWDQRFNDGRDVPPGTYVVRAEVLTETDPLATPTRELRIRS
jgi:hypothetical protein